MTQPIGILGGTFDPIHKGHIAIAQFALSALPLSHIELIPSYQPPHKDQPIATATQRFEMAMLATKSNPLIQVNDIEIKRKDISYTVDTLKEIRNKIPSQSLCFILGADALTHIDTWHEWQKITTLAHLIVMGRPAAISPQHQDVITLINQCETKSILDIQTYPAGKIYFLKNKPNPISATDIRHALHLGKTQMNELDPLVEKYIKENNIYT